MECKIDTRDIFKLKLKRSAIQLKTINNVMICESTVFLFQLTTIEWRPIASGITVTRKGPLFL